MILITIKGPVGSGKTRIANEIIKHCQLNNIKCHHAETNNDASIKLIKPDVLIVEKH